MRHDVNYIPFEQFQDIIVRSGLPWEEKAGFVKVSGSAGHKVYVPRTQRVGRVDISGFTYPGQGVVALGDDERWGRVTQQLDFSGTPDETLEVFISVLQHMAELPPEEPRSRAPRGSEGQDTGRVRRGRPSMTVPPPGPSAQEARRDAQGQAAREAKDTRGGQKKSNQKQPSHRR